MFRKGALPIVVLTTISSALFFSWVSGVFKDIDIAVVDLVIFMAYFVAFLPFFGSIYDIIHKVNIKSNKYLLGSSISAVIAFTAFFKGVQYSNVYLGYLFVLALVCFMLLTRISSKYEKQ